ncbi:hypothetical protein KIL84_017572 [Mauremys mutica]|uniref:Uncharacterized protein n=1 Tax=Mauremys mutica TaxID=74926 RepID=A0A9D3X6G5_9SAUR|nr:hypothetical protein KIL84_017572 [Mauremys mutica]
MEKKKSDRFENPILNTPVLLSSLLFQRLLFQLKDKKHARLSSKTPLSTSNDNSTPMSDHQVPATNEFPKGGLFPINSKVPAKTKQNHQCTVTQIALVCHNLL